MLKNKRGVDEWYTSFEAEECESIKENERSPQESIVARRDSATELMTMLHHHNTRVLFEQKLDIREENSESGKQ